MSRRPLPPVEGPVAVEHGIGPAAGVRVDEDPAPPAEAPSLGLVHSAPAGEQLQDREPVDVPPPPPPDQAIERPRAQDLIQRRAEIPREQVNGATPKVLQLRRRMRQLQLDHDVELRDQIALAMDEWLRNRGY